VSFEPLILISNSQQITAYCCFGSIIQDDNQIPE